MPLGQAHAGCVAMCAEQMSQAQSASVRRQGAKPKPGKINPAPAAASNLPSDMLPVGEPGKVHEVHLGSNSEEIINFVEQWHPHNEHARLKALKKMSTELGMAKVDVASYYLAKFPVTNRQYLQFVKATGHRFPFHWWKVGKKEHYIESLKDIRIKFPKDNTVAPLLYWDVNYKTLPYAIPKGQEDCPVNFVDFRDAFMYAAWAGMRLPTEAEWTLAASGTERKNFVFGNEWHDDVLKNTGINSSRDKVLKSVGSLKPFVDGPYGHREMVFQVAEWVDDYFSYVGDFDDHAKEYKKLRKHKKYGGKLPELVHFKDGHRMAKGGCQFTLIYEAWDETRIASRIPLSEGQTLEGVGFRVAKSLRPAYDTSLALLKVDYDHSFLPEGHEPDLTAQNGIERYSLNADGSLIQNYQALSFIPLGFLSKAEDFKLTGSKGSLEAASMRKPVALGVFITTEEIAEPKLSKGTYTVYYRKAGVPKDLEDAVKAASKVLLKQKAAEEKAAKNAKRKKKEEKKDKEDDKQSKDQEKLAKAMKIAKKFGISEESILAAGKKPLTCLETVYLSYQDGRQEKQMAVDTTKNQFIFRSSDGAYRASMVTLNKLEKKDPSKKDRMTRLLNVSNGDGIISTSFVVPIHQKEFEKKKKKGNAHKVSPFKFSFKLAKPW